MKVTVAQYECLQCHHRWVDHIEWEWDPFLEEYKEPEPSPEERAKYWKCGECFVKGKAKLVRKEVRG